MAGDVIRLLILQKYGGVFVESDVYPTKPLDSLVCRYDYFTAITNQVHFYYLPKVEINVLGSSPGHPITRRTLDLIINNMEKQLREFDKEWIVDIARQDLKDT